MAQRCNVATFILSSVILLTCTSSGAETPTVKAIEPSNKDAADDGSRVCGCAQSTICSRQRSDRAETSASCICDLYPFFHVSDDFWLFYSLEYEECEDPCNEYITVYNDGGPTTVYPEECPNCGVSAANEETEENRPSSRRMKSDLALGQPKPAEYDDDDYEREFQEHFPDAKIDCDAFHPITVEFIGNNRVIRATLFLIEFQPEQQALPVVAAFGCEIERGPQKVDAVEKVAKYRDFEHLYEVKIGYVTYVVITAKE
jgi:hypothetical protein